jgi:hypothetical protein
MTPLEMARQNEGKIFCCGECDKLVEIKGVFYCEESGKIILPMFIERGEGNGPSMGCSVMKWKFERRQDIE